MQGRDRPKPPTYGQIFEKKAVQKGIKREDGSARVRNEPDKVSKRPQNNNPLANQCSPGKLTKFKNLDDIPDGIPDILPLSSFQSQNRSRNSEMDNYWDTEQDDGNIDDNESDYVQNYSSQGKHNVRTDKYGNEIEDDDFEDIRYGSSSSHNPSQKTAVDCNQNNSYLRPTNSNLHEYQYQKHNYDPKNSEFDENDSFSSSPVKYRSNNQSKFSPAKEVDKFPLNPNAPGFKKESNLSKPIMPSGGNGGRKLSLDNELQAISKQAGVYSSSSNSSSPRNISPLVPSGKNVGFKNNNMPQQSNPPMLPYEKKQSSSLEEQSISTEKGYKKIEYKPYTLEQYRQIRPKEYMEISNIKPDLNSEELIAKRSNLARVKEFSKQLKVYNEKAILQLPKKPSAVEEEQIVKSKGNVESNRSRALNFAKNIPKPKTNNDRHISDEANFVDNEELELETELFGDMSMGNENLKRLLEPNPSLEARMAELDAKHKENMKKVESIAKRRK